MRKKILIGLGVIILLPILVILITRLTQKSQTVGSVTANRDASALKITEVAAGTWKHPETVIGKAYKIEKIKDSKKPVHVEFAYNSADIDPKIPETALRLYKWHGEAKNPYWAPVKSAVDTTRHVVTANLTSFSILAVHAPLMYYWPKSDVDSLNAYLASLTKKFQSILAAL